MITNELTQSQTDILRKLGYTNVTDSETAREIFATLFGYQHIPATAIAKAEEVYNAQGFIDGMLAKGYRTGELAEMSLDLHSYRSELCKLYSASYWEGYQLQSYVHLMVFKSR